MDTKISIVQLIRAKEVSVNLEIERIRADEGVSIAVEQFFLKCPDYVEILQKLEETERLMEAASPQDKPFYNKKLSSLKEIETDFRVNTLLMCRLFAAQTFTSEKLKKAEALFCEGRIHEANQLLEESTLLDDQFYLIFIADYYETRLKLSRYE